LPTSIPFPYTTLFRSHKLPSGYDENKHLTLTLTGNRMQESWTQAQKPSDFFMFKGYVDMVLQRLGINKIQTQPATNDVFSEGLADRKSTRLNSSHVKI